MKKGKRYYIYNIYTDRKYTKIDKYILYKIHINANKTEYLNMNKDSLKQAVFVYCLKINSIMAAGIEEQLIVKRINISYIFIPENFLKNKHKNAEKPEKWAFFLDFRVNHTRPNRAIL